MKHLRGIAISTLAACLVTGSIAWTRGQAQEEIPKDPFVGTWKINLAKSTYDPARLTPKRGATIKREAYGTDAYRVTADLPDSEGGTMLIEYLATLDGKDCRLTGSPDYDSVALRRLDANTLISVNKLGGVVTRMMRIVISKDGKTSTSDQVGYNAQGVAFHNVAVSERQ